MCKADRFFVGILSCLSLLLVQGIVWAQITVSIAPDDKSPPPKPPATRSIQQGGDARIHQEILRTYNFQPHLLSSQQIQQHSAILDGFWANARAQKEVYVPVLERELADFQNPPFFLYDGSMLLLSLSDTSTHRNAALAAIAHCDLRDVQAKDYFFQVHRLAAAHENTTAAAFHILEDPKFTVFVPQHALTLGQNYALIYLLLPTDQAFWVGPAIESLNSESGTVAQRSLLLLLWYAQTPEADNAIASFAADTNRPGVSRSYGAELLKRKDQLDATIRNRASASTEDEIRKKRQERMKAVSDEALIDLDEYTALLIAKRRQATAY